MCYGCELVGLLVGVVCVLFGVLLGDECDVFVKFV